MANLLPVNEAAKQLERKVHELLTAAQKVREHCEVGDCPPKFVIKNWKQAYSEVSAAQWELETVLGVN
jgi:hypothetical protein